MINTPIKCISGFREWVVLKDLKKKPILTKLDTGARTSTLHALNSHMFQKSGETWLKFDIYKRLQGKKVLSPCKARLIDRRFIFNSKGHKELRYIIHVDITLGLFTWPIELSLTDRACMKYELLLGRSALNHHVIVDPSQSFVLASYKDLL